MSFPDKQITTSNTIEYDWKKKVTNVNDFQWVQDQNPYVNIDSKTADIEVIEASFKIFKDEICKRMDALEEQVVLVQRDTVLEKDFKELKEAWKAYNDLLEKLKTFKALQDSA